MSYVTYITINPDGSEEKYNNVPCFSDIRRYDLTKLGFVIVFECKPQALTKEKLEFWAGFLLAMLGEEDWTWCYEGDKLVWYLDAKEMSFHKALTYLTGFRYIEEFPVYIEELFKHKDLPIDELFIKFQEFHMGDTCLGGNSNHNYISDFTAPNKKDIPISLKRFKEHLADPSMERVASHFSK